MKLRTKLLIIFSLALVIQGIVIGYQFNERAVSTVYQDKDGNKLLRWVIEIVSANSRDEDFLNKLFYYRQIGLYNIFT